MNEIDIDCARCEVRGSGCEGCIMSHLLDDTEGILRLNGEQARAVRVLAAAGLVPESRMQFGNGLKVV